MEWYKENPEDLLSQLETNKDLGLSEKYVQEKLEKEGYNELKEEKGKSFLSKVLAQFNDFLVIILIVASIVSFFAGETVDSIVIIAIVILNALLGLYQEGKAEKSLEALKEMSAPDAKVIRDGTTSVVPSKTLVPGDIVILEAGDITPADLRFIQSSNLKVEEASLTGESLPVEKNTEVIDRDESLGDRTNMGFMSTIVTYGRATGVVVATGHDTEIGQIASQIQSIEDETTPLQKKLDQLGKYLGIGCIAISIFIFIVGAFQGRNLLDMFMIAVSLAVAAIPEGLPAIVTIVLALGMNRMVKRNAIVKKLLAVETLGSTTIICSDKTGTLTQNKMTIVKTYTNGKISDIPKKEYDEDETKNSPNMERLINIGALCNDAILEKYSEGYEVIGDPTEGSLITLARKNNIFPGKLNQEYPRIEELPFESNRKMMTTIHENFSSSEYTSLTKGAPDIVIDRCNRIYIDGEIKPLTDELKKDLLERNRDFSREALRVLALAFKPYDDLPKDIKSENLETDMVFVGLVAMMDPPREEVKVAIANCKRAGIIPIMITGDYKETAFAIAKDLGIAEYEDQTITGTELDKMTDEDLKERVKSKKVYARVSPEHKVKIVDAFKANGEIIAMTGDGVNDAPALKRADIGIAMGITGTDVAKNTAEVILTDDNFSSIVSAVEEGRIIYSNIKKFVFFLLSCNIGEILIILVSILLGLKVPLLPIQLLWLNLVTDSFPALALGVEKGEKGIMKIPPRDPNESILDKSMIKAITIQSIAIATGSLLAYFWGLKTYGPEGLLRARTITFATLILAELLRAYSSRSEKKTIFEMKIFSNKTLNRGTSLSFILLIVVLYVPFLQKIFHTFPLQLNDWKIIALYSILPLIVGEIYKVILRKQLKK